MTKKAIRDIMCRQVDIARMNKDDEQVGKLNACLSLSFTGFLMGFIVHSVWRGQEGGTIDGGQMAEAE